MNHRDHSGNRTGTRRGSALIEMALMAPWLFFLFVGVFDLGFYAYALISVQNAARVAVLNMSRTSSEAVSAAATADACAFIRQELASMPNATSFAANCGTGTLVVTTSYIVAASAADAGATDCGGSGCGPAASVTVGYQTMPLIPIPGFLPTQLTFHRTVQMRVRGS